MTRQPTEIVEALWQRIWIDGALDTLDDLIADPYVRHTRNGTSTHSPAEYGGVIAAAVDVIRGTRVQIDDIAATGDTVWARMTLHAVNIGVGTDTTITWLGQYRIAHDRIAESWVLHESGLDWNRD
jgi:hypothetical protein